MSSILVDLPVNDNNRSADDEDEIIATSNKSRRQVLRKPFIESDDDGEDDDEHNKTQLSMMLSSDDDYDSDDDDEKRKSISLDEALGKKASNIIDSVSVSNSNKTSTGSGNHTGTVLAAQAATKKRRRRRSSARFLRLSGRFDPSEDVDGDMDDMSNITNNNGEQLGDMYKRAIRMNAENRINAGNSWGLNLIDNIDKFLADDENDSSGNKCRSISSRTKASDKTNFIAHFGNDHEDSSAKDGDVAEGDKRVNFTKASCTLDASVKIYSYRVDDVHLTSYKVLANLNRTDQGKKKSNSGEHGHGDNIDTKHDTLDYEDDDDDVCATGDGRKRGGSRRKETSNATTLESNKSNINVSKLDSAYDIDPLFHKMSKTFDEGGAKGLLLANLGVGNNGCDVIFDSKEDDFDNNNATTSNTPVEDSKGKCGFANDNAPANEGMINISSLSSKLGTLLGRSTIDAFSLVPQLALLREEHAQLDAEGFIKEDSKKKSRRYAISQKEEKEAEKSIHEEAMERSRMSLGTSFAGRFSVGTSFIGNSDDVNDDDGVEANGFDVPTSGADAPIDFGSGNQDYDDGDDDDGDYAFNDFMATDDAGRRYSSISFRQSEEYPLDGIPPSSDDINNSMVLDDSIVSTAQATNSATVFLDALISGDVLLSGGSQYEYFNSESLSQITGGNLWAGSAHWKKSERPTRSNYAKDNAKMPPKKGPKKTPLKRSGNKKGNKLQVSLDLSSTVPSEVLIDMLIQPTKPKRGASNPLQFSKAMVTKYSKADNLLPPDAGIGIEQLTKLFMRPNAVMKSSYNEDTYLPSNDNSNALTRRKTVGFHDLDEPLSGGFDDGCDDSLVDDNDGPGFDLAGPTSDDTYGGCDDDDFVVELEGVRKVEKMQVGYASVAKKVDVKRLKKDMWAEIESSILLPSHPEGTSAPTSTFEKNTVSSEENVLGQKDNELQDKKGEEKNCGDSKTNENLEETRISFKKTVKEMESAKKSQTDATLPFYFICVLHLANEKGLKLESSGLEDFVIANDYGSIPSFGTLPTSTKKSSRSRKQKVEPIKYNDDLQDNDDD